MWIQHIQKALNEMNLHLHHVLTDISGQSGVAILDAILAGERDPKKLASLIDHRVKKSQAQVEAALTGDLATIAACTVRKQDPEQTPPPQQGAPVKARTSKRKPKDALELSLAGHLKRILGVDLTTLPGLNVLAVLSLISEIGTNNGKVA